MTRTPYNLEAEQLLLSASLFGPRARIDELAEIVTPDDFYDPIHQVLWSAAVRFAERGVPMTAEGLNRILEQARGTLGAEAIDGYVPYLRDGEVPHAPPQLARQVRDYALRRRLMAIAQDLMTDAAEDDPTRSAADRLEAVEQRLFELSEFGAERPPGLAMDGVLAGCRDLIDRAQKANGGTTGLPTGIVDLDRRLSGLQAGELYIVAGRPAMGKTAFGLTLAYNAARAGGKVRFNSLEMPAAQLGQRLIAGRTGISVQDQRRPMSLEQHRQIGEAEAKLQALPMIVDDSDTQTIASIRTGARRQKRRFGLDLLVVDYLGLVQPLDPKGQTNRAYQIEEITKGLKRLAKNLGIPVVLLCQINRGVEQRDDKRPTLSDLRDSGAIEQDADVVMLLYREEYYLQQQEPSEPGKIGDWMARLDSVRGVVECITAKFRQGETGTDRIHFDGTRQRFTTLDKWGR